MDGTIELGTPWPVVVHMGINPEPINDVCMVRVYIQLRAQPRPRGHRFIPIHHLVLMKFFSREEGPKCYVVPHQFQTFGLVYVL